MFKRINKADYIAFNIELVKEVEKHPCLYNYNLKEYNNREIVQDTWDLIAEKFDCTAKECRDTWKNLRIVFSRNVKKPSSSSAAKRRPYYLLESMRYLMPFLKIDNSSPKPVNSITDSLYCETTSSNEQNSIRGEEDDYIRSFNEQSANITQLELAMKEEYDSTDEQYSQETSIEPPSKKQKSQHVNSDENFPQRVSMEFLRKETEKIQTDTQVTASCECSKNNTSVSSSKRANSRHQFLLSLLPDLDDMNESQFRSFRFEICKLIDSSFNSLQPSTSQITNGTSKPSP